VIHAENRPGNRRGAAFAALTLLVFVVAGPAAGNTATSFDIEEFRGRVVIVDFWASWCAPCRQSFPWLDDLQARYAEDGLVVIGINVDANASDARAFLDEFPVRFRIIEDSDGTIAKEFDVIAMPSSYVFGRDGKLIARHLGFRSRDIDEYEAVIRQSLAL